MSVQKTVSRHLSCDRKCHICYVTGTDDYSMMKKVQNNLLAYLNIYLFPQEKAINTGKITGIFSIHIKCINLCTNGHGRNYTCSLLL